ncbi:hypothetical protein [Thermosipho globiformans]|uniref:hypothetical protein n=1 Tax=Thermosipho globiformans TaxID=380685 RepID=UPI000F8E157E|nr:hypothetical protein [Thermosipho globiformans]
MKVYYAEDTLKVPVNIDEQTNLFFSRVENLLSDIRKAITGHSSMILYNPKETKIGLFIVLENKDMLKEKLYRLVDEFLDFTSGD